MRIMCLNGWGGKMHGQLLPYLQTEQPDVLCLQEVVHTPSSNTPWLTYRDKGIELPQRANFFADICAVLPNHAGIFCPAAQGDLWEDETRFDSQWGLATFVHKSLPIIGQNQGFVHKEFSENGYGAHPRSRSAHAVRLYDFNSKSSVTICHMHGLRDLSGKQDTKDRIVQASRLIALVQAVAQPEDKVVVCGDSNILPESKTFEMFAEFGLKDLVTGRGHKSTRTSAYKKSGKFADYMLVNDALAGAKFDIVRTPEVSDHCPLVLTIG